MDLNIMHEFVVGSYRPDNSSEREKTQAIVNQLGDSIGWLNQEADSQKNYEEKIELQKEATAATWERDRLIKELAKN